VRLRRKHTREVTHIAVYIAIGEIGPCRMVLGVHPTVLGAMNRAAKTPKCVGRDYDNHYIERWDVDATAPAASWVCDGGKWELME
jgi:hypothetical protein